MSSRRCTAAGHRRPKIRLLLRRMVSTTLSYSFSDMKPVRGEKPPLHSSWTSQDCLSVSSMVLSTPAFEPALSSENRSIRVPPRGRGGHRRAEASLEGETGGDKSQHVGESVAT